MKLFFAAFLISFAMMTVASDLPLPKQDQSGWCCACMCGSKAQDKCAMSCLRMTQPGSPVITEDQMAACTRQCQHKFASRDREKKLQCPGEKGGTRG